MRLLARAALSAALSTTLVAPFALAQDADPLACARTADGVPIKIGTPVVDPSGKPVGSVSLSQCAADAKAAELRIWLERSLGGEIRSINLAGVKATSDAVILPVTAEALAGSDAYAASDDASG